VALAHTYGAVFKPTNGRWVILGYDAMPEAALTIDQTEVTEFSAHFQARPHFPTVIAHYHDYDKAKRVPVQVGSGDKPITRLDKTFDSEAIARAHARAALNKGIRQARRVRLRLPGRPALQTLTKVALTGFREELNRDWLITEVTHTLDSRGYRCEIDAEGVTEQQG
jgi:phage protein D